MALQFADRLNLLFQAFPQPGSSTGKRREWSDSTVARVAGELTGETAITRQYIGMLRKGERTEPSLSRVHAIARAFEHLAAKSGTPCEAGSIIAYLATSSRNPDADTRSEADRVHEQLTQTAQRHEDMIGVLARLGELNEPASFDAVYELLDRLAEQEAEPARRKLARRLGFRPKDSR